MTTWQQKVNFVAYCNKWNELKKTYQMQYTTYNWMILVSIYNSARYRSLFTLSSYAANLQLWNRNFTFVTEKLLSLFCFAYWLLSLYYCASLNVSMWSKHRQSNITEHSIWLYRSCQIVSYTRVLNGSEHDFPEKWAKLLSFHLKIRPKQRSCLTLISLI